MKLNNSVILKSAASALSVLVLFSAVSAKADDCYDAFKRSSAANSCEVQAAQYVSSSLCMVQVRCKKSNGDYAYEGYLGHTFYINEVPKLWNDNGELKVK